MNRLLRNILLLMVAVVLAAGATYLSIKWLQRQAALQKRPGLTNRVVVAEVDLVIGSKLTPNLIKAVPWPRESIPKESFNDPGQLTDRVVKTTLYAGEPVLEMKLAPKGMTGGLSAVISEDKRALTVKVSEISGVAGFTLPGRKVDILVTIEDEQKKEPITKMILQNMKVLAVDQSVDQSGDKPVVVNAVTMEVTPAETEILAMAEGEGRIGLALRNEVDQKFVPTKGVHKSGLIPAIRVPATVEKVAYNPPKPSPNTIEVIRGVTKTKVESLF
ncbi:MAG: Flp pilus assembly protein CpaB [Nitrospinae bacterium RIFCSPLOWO2_12_FULL_45_22]|nr:MAG: Flp pilus assembly protein CpaB [Nitrospinae bacterium RIFCSPLOWO2_12_FULL_45_22]